MYTVDPIQTLLFILVIITNVVASMVVFYRLRAQQQNDTERLLARMEQSLGVSVKLLEVRNYYDQISAEYKKMLDEAYREGSRFRQDHVRRLIERLEQLKARTLDRTVRILESEEARPFRRRRRRHFPPGGQPPGGQPPGGQPQAAPQKPPQQPPRQPPPQPTQS